MERKLDFDSSELLAYICVGRSWLSYGESPLRKLLFRFRQEQPTTQPVSVSAVCACVRAKGRPSVIHASLCTYACLCLVYEVCIALALTLVPCSAPLWPSRSAACDANACPTRQRVEESRSRALPCLQYCRLTRIRVTPQAPDRSMRTRRLETQVGPSERPGFSIASLSLRSEFSIASVVFSSLESSPGGLLHRAIGAGVKLQGLGS